MESDSNMPDKGGSLEEQARKFWNELNSQLPEDLRLAKNEIECALQTASDIGLQVMAERFMGDRTFSWKNVAYNLMRCHPCKTCLIDLFNEGFDAEYARDPLANVERVRKYHGDHISQVPSGIYSINRQIFAEMGAERALEPAQV